MSTWWGKESLKRACFSQFRLAFRSRKTPPKNELFNWQLLKDDKDLQSLYSVTIRNKYHALCDKIDEEEPPVTKLYSKLIETNNETANELLPTRQKDKIVRSENDPQVSAARINVKNAFANYQRSPTDENEENLQSENRKLLEAYVNAEANVVSSLVDKVENADIKGQHAESWRFINKLSGRKTTRKGVLKGNSSQERLNNWYKHFNNLLGKEPSIPDNTLDGVIPNFFDENDLGIETGPFTLEEL